MSTPQYCLLCDQLLEQSEDEICYGCMMQAEESEPQEAEPVDVFMKRRGRRERT